MRNSIIVGSGGPELVDPRRGNGHRKKSGEGSCQELSVPSYCNTDPKHTEWRGVVSVDSGTALSALLIPRSHASRAIRLYRASCDRLQAVAVHVVARVKLPILGIQVYSRDRFDLSGYLAGYTCTCCTDMHMHASSAFHGFTCEARRNTRRGGIECVGRLTPTDDRLRLPVGGNLGRRAP